MAQEAFRCWVHDRHHWDVRELEKLAGADGGAGATLFCGRATATENHPTAAVGTTRLCVIKHHPDSEDPDMKQEQRVLENLLAKGTPIRTGAGDYYLGCRSTDDDGIRLFLSFDKEDLDLARRWRIKTKDKDPKVFCKPQPLALALRICLGVLEALRPLHGNGMVHMDVQPKNVLYNELTGTVTLIDYAAVVQIGASGEKVRERTWEYSAPEQWSKQECTRRTDGFAVVGLLIYLVTGEAPFYVPGGGGGAHKKLCLKVVHDKVCGERETLLDRTEAGSFVARDTQHNAGLDEELDGKPHGLRHLLWMGMRPMKEEPVRWGCEKLAAELAKLLAFEEKKGQKK